MKFPTHWSSPVVNLEAVLALVLLRSALKDRRAKQRNHDSRLESQDPPLLGATVVRLTKKSVAI